ncbi:hypothetical protein [Kaarinaea lacus]
MKTYTKRPPGYFKLAALAFIGFVASTVFVQGTAFATTAANTLITNQATVNYDDSAGNAQAAINASVNVTVNLLEATPSFTSPPADQSVFSGSPASYPYTITANANGVDTYNLTSTQTAADAGIGATTTVFRNISDTADITDITLGATSVAAGVTITAAGTTAVTVPSDGAADGSLNGLIAGDTVVVNGVQHTVNSITDNASGTSTLVLNGNAGGDNAVTVGMQIGERAQFIFRVTPTTTVDSATVTYEVSARDDASVAAATTDSTVTTVQLAPSVTVTKYVRNVGPCHGTLSDCNPAAGAVTINGEDYWTAGVTGDPGDTLEYVIVVANAANSGTATDVIISDPIPAFTTFVANSLLLDNDTAADGSTAAGWAITPTDAEDDGDEGEYRAANTTVYIYAGSGGDDTDAGAPPYGTGGSLAGGSYTFGAFRVTIDN